MINYLIQASIGLAAFYSFYWLVLRKSKLLNINRAYLLISSFLALVFPILDLPLLPSAPFQYTASVPLESVAPTNWEQVLAKIALWIYLAGLLIKLAISGMKIGKLLRLEGEPLQYAEHGIRIIEVRGMAAFSFLKRVYLGHEIMADEEIKKHVLNHEMSHVKGLHSLDLLYFELIQAVFWFNPFAYFYMQSIKMQHEYIADQDAVEGIEGPVYEQSLIKIALAKVNPMLVSHFGQHPIEQRIHMLNQTNKNKMKQLKPILALPIAALLFICFACSENEPEAEVIEVVEEVSEIPVEGEILEVEEVPSEASDVLYELQEVVYEEPSEEKVLEIDEGAEVIHETPPSEGEVIIEEQY